MNNEEAHDLIVKWLAKMTGVQVIKSHQSGKRPDKPYIMTELILADEVREHDQRLNYYEIDGEPFVENELEAEWTISVHFYGKGGLNILFKLKNRYRLPGAQTEIAPLLIHGFGPINSVPEQVKNEWEPRAHCNLFARGITTDSIEVDTIESASITLN